MAASKLTLVPNRLLGVDVSNHQNVAGGGDPATGEGGIDWDALAECGVVWCYIKEGEDRKIQQPDPYDYYVDPFFAWNFREAMRVGMIAAGVYRFVRPTGTAPADSVTRAEAHVRSAVGDGGLPSRAFFVCDFEEDAGGDQLQWLSEFDNGVRDSVYLCNGHGEAVWNYSGETYLSRHGCLVPGSTPTVYNYIHAAYQKNRPPAPLGYTMKAWQFYDKAQLPGIVGDVDVNTFLGSASDLMICCMP